MIEIHLLSGAVITLSVACALLARSCILLARGQRILVKAQGQTMMEIHRLACVNSHLRNALKNRLVVGAAEGDLP